MAGPGFEGIGEPEVSTEDFGEPIGPDDWYSVGPEDDTGTAAAGGSIESYSAPVLEAWASRRNWMIGGIALILLLAGALGYSVWRRKRLDKLPPDEEGPSLARGVSDVIHRQMSTSVRDIADGIDDAPAPTTPLKPEVTPKAATQPTPDPLPQMPAAAPAPKPADEPDSDQPPARIDITLDIIGATRSLMMFTLEFRLELANRSDRAVRDISVAGKLASAARGAANAAPLAGGQPVGEIARIGPQQSRAITGRLQMPLAEVTPILQGNKPLMIPLLHLTIEGKGCTAMSRSFVIGAPSQTGSGRVHPLALDGPPGSMPELRAQAIKAFDGGVHAETT